MIDLNFEEVGCDRNITDASFANGLQNFRFSVSPAGNGSWIPSMSYFLVEYAFGSNEGATDAYSPIKQMRQTQKIALANDFMGSMYSASSFRMAGSDICNVSNSHAQVSVLKKRMKYGSNKMQNLSGDLNAFEVDFSKRLAKTSIDGLYHKDGLIDCSPYNSYPTSPFGVDTDITMLSKSGASLGRDANGNYNGTGNCVVSTPPVNGNWSWIFSRSDGDGEIAHDADDNTIVRSMYWILPPGSKSGTSSLIMDGLLINAGQKFQLRIPAKAGVVGLITFEGAIFETTGLVVDDNNYATIVLNIGGNVTVAIIKAMFTASNQAVGQGAIFNVSGLVAQADPRSNVVNGMCVYQPPLSVFDQDEGVFIGDMQLILTPNSNWKQCVVESAPRNTTYDQDVAHGTDYCFGIKSLRFYIARTRVLEELPKQLNFSMPDMIVSNKQISNGQQNLDFIVPPSTQQIVIWIQDSSVGNNTKLSYARFKARQNCPAGDLKRMEKFGPWAKTYDENLQSIQLTFAGITKPMTLFQTGNGGSTSQPTVSVSMLQRYLMNNQNQQRSDHETFYDWLSSGAYYTFDFTRDSTNLGTYLSVKIAYNGDYPTQGKTVGDLASVINLYVCSIYRRDFALTYSELGNVVAVQSAMQ